MEEFKWAVLIAATLLGAIVLGLKGCSIQTEAELRAPIIETCVKHPATRRVSVQ